MSRRLPVVMTMLMPAAGSLVACKHKAMCRRRPDSACLLQVAQWLGAGEDKLTVAPTSCLPSCWASMLVGDCGLAGQCPV